MGKGHLEEGEEFAGEDDPKNQKSVLDMFNSGFRFKYFNYGEEEENVVQNVDYWETNL